MSDFGSGKVSGIVTTDVAYSHPTIPHSLSRPSVRSIRKLLILFLFQLLYLCADEFSKFFSNRPFLSSAVFYLLLEAFLK